MSIVSSIATSRRKPYAGVPMEGPIASWYARTTRDRGDYPVTARSIAERLPDKRSRELAFGLAASIVTADAKMPPSEIEFLKALQRQFGLSEEDVARLFELAEDKAPLPPT